MPVQSHQPIRELLSKAQYGFTVEFQPDIPIKSDREMIQMWEYARDVKLQEII